MTHNHHGELVPGSRGTQTALPPLCGSGISHFCTAVAFQGVSFATCLGRVGKVFPYLMNGTHVRQDWAGGWTLWHGTLGSSCKCPARARESRVGPIAPLGVLGGVASPIVRAAFPPHPCFDREGAVPAVPALETVTKRRPDWPNIHFVTIQGTTAGSRRNHFSSFGSYRRRKIPPVVRRRTSPNATRGSKDKKFVPVRGLEEQPR